MRRPMPWILRILLVTSAITAYYTSHGLYWVADWVAGAGPEYQKMYVSMRGMRVQLNWSGYAYTRDEFIWDYAVPSLAGLGVLCAFAWGAACGLLVRRYWARPFLLALPVAALLFSVTGSFALGGDGRYLWRWLLGGALTLVFLWWVLYWRDDVVDWFESLREAE